MKNKTIVLPCLVILITAVIYFAIRAQQKNGTHNFSGEWISEQSISMGGNIVCSYVNDDRMRSKTMKIAQQPDFLTIEIPNPSPGALQATNREKLAFDGKESQVDHRMGNRKKFTVKMSADGQTMTVHSIVYLMVPTPYHTDVQQQMLVYVTEVWKLSNDGKSISVQANAKSNIFSGERFWNTIFNKVG